MRRKAQRAQWLWHEDSKAGNPRHNGTRGPITTPDQAPRVPKNSKSLEKNVGNRFSPEVAITVLGPFHSNLWFFKDTFRPLAPCDRPRGLNCFQHSTRLDLRKIFHYFFLKMAVMGPRRTILTVFGHFWRFFITWVPIYGY